MIAERERGLFVKAHERAIATTRCRTVPVDTLSLPAFQDFQAFDDDEDGMNGDANGTETVVEEEGIPHPSIENLFLALSGRPEIFIPPHDPNADL